MGDAACWESLMGGEGDRNPNPDIVLLHSASSSNRLRRQQNILAALLVPHQWQEVPGEDLWEINTSTNDGNGKGGKKRHEFCKPRRDGVFFHTPPSRIGGEKTHVINAERKCKKIEGEVCAGKGGGQKSGIKIGPWWSWCLDEAAH